MKSTVSGICVGEPGVGRSRHDLAEDRRDGELDAGRPRELGRPDTRRTDDGARLDRSPVRHDADDAFAVRLDARRGAAGDDRCAVSASARRVSLRDRLGAGVAVESAEGRREHAVETCERGEPARLLGIDHATGDAELVLERDALLEDRHVLGSVEEEQVADLPEVDLAARTSCELCERLDSTQPDGDVQRVGELRSDPARRTTGRPGRQRVAFEQGDVDARFREVEGDARPDGAASDDDDVRLAREVGHPRTRFLRKKRRFAGRSARRRIRYGYQSGPNGVATSTLWL